MIDLSKFKKIEEEDSGLDDLLDLQSDWVERGELKNLEKLCPDGTWMHRFVDYAVDTKGLDVTESIIGGLSAASIAAGGRYAIVDKRGPIFPNCNFMFVGPTSCGKDLLVNTIKSVIPEQRYIQLKEVAVRGHDPQMVPTEFTSSIQLANRGSYQAITKTLWNKRCGYISNTEFEENLKLPKDSASCWENLILALFGANPSVIIAYKNESEMLDRPLQFPVLSSILGIQTTNFISACTMDKFTSGYIPRMCITYMTEKPITSDDPEDRKLGEMYGLIATELSSIVYADRILNFTKDNSPFRLIPDYMEEMVVESDAYDLHKRYKQKILKSMEERGMAHSFQYIEKYINEYTYKFCIALRIAHSSKKRPVVPIIDMSIMHLAHALSNFFSRNVLHLHSEIKSGSFVSQLFLAFKTIKNEWSTITQLKHKKHSLYSVSGPDFKLELSKLIKQGLVEQNGERYRAKIKKETVEFD